MPDLFAAQIGIAATPLKTAATPLDHGAIPSTLLHHLLTMQYHCGSARLGNASEHACARAPTHPPTH